MVGTLGAAIVRGLQDNGVAACGKHFPGHGDTAVDSHDELPIVEHPPDRIRRVECVPFRDAIRADVAFIMTAHLLVPSLDENTPATLSRPVVHGLLREELGFDGVILSDDLEMEALARAYTVPEAAVQAIAAGCDGVLVCRARAEDRSGDIEVQAAVLDALVHAVEDGRIPYKRLEDALSRHRRAKERFSGGRRAPRATRGGPEGPVLRCARLRTSIAASRTKWRGTCDQASHAQARRPHRPRVARQPVRAHQVRAGSR